MPPPRIKQPLPPPFPFPWGIPNPVAVVVECNFSPATPVRATVSTTANPDPNHASSTATAVPPPLIVGHPTLPAILVANPPPHQDYYVTADAAGQGADFKGVFRLTNAQDGVPVSLRRGGVFGGLVELLAGLFGYKRVRVGGPVIIPNPGAVVVAAFRDTSVPGGPNAYVGAKAKMVVPVAAGGRWETAFWLTGPAGTHYNFWVMEFNAEGVLSNMWNLYKPW